MSMTKNLASPSDWNRHLLKKKTNSAVSVRRVNVDILTGKEAVSAYFDPSKSVDCDVNDSEWMGENLFIPAIIIKDDNGLVSMRLPSGEVYKMNTADVVRVTDNDDEGVDDILKLRDFSEMSLIHTLRVRYFRGAIYTFVGPILVSINPYKYIKGIYSEKTMASYHSADKNYVLAPHLFSIADSSYSALMHRKSPSGKARDQSIIISGESGSGKTESTKVVMSYLARITAMDTVSSAPIISASSEKPLFNVGELEQRVLDTNPLLEAFGNARTLRNDNSSRFGKFIKINFSNSGKIIGATIEKYLLEKTRVIHQTP
eukprot:gene2488-3367_t